MKSAKIEGTKYRIYEDGRLINEKTGRILKWHINKQGYYQTMISTNCKLKCVKQHKLIAEYFIEKPEHKTQVNHINGIKTDNRIINLEWVTQSENAIHAYKHGLRKFVPINRKKVIHYPSGIIFLSVAEAANYLNISVTYASQMLSGALKNTKDINYYK